MQGKSAALTEKGTGRRKPFGSFLRCVKRRFGVQPVIKMRAPMMIKMRPPITLAWRFKTAPACFPA